MRSTFVERITVDPKVMGGVPCIRGLRIPVATVVGLVANGFTAEQVVAELPPWNRRMSPPRFGTPLTQSPTWRFSCRRRESRDG